MPRWAAAWTKALDFYHAHPCTLIICPASRAQVPGYFAAVDAGGRLAQLGWQKFPTLLHLAWGAQWLDYSLRLAANLSRPALVLPVFHHQVHPNK